MAAYRYLFICFSRGWGRARAPKCALTGRSGRLNDQPANCTQRTVQPRTWATDYAHETVQNRSFAKGKADDVTSSRAMWPRDDAAMRCDKPGLIKGSKISPGTGRLSNLLAFCCLCWAICDEHTKLDKHRRSHGYFLIL